MAEEKAKQKWCEGKGDPLTRNVYVTIGEQLLVMSIGDAVEVVRVINEAICEAAPC